MTTKMPRLRTWTWSEIEQPDGAFRVAFTALPPAGYERYTVTGSYAVGGSTTARWTVRVLDIDTGALAEVADTDSLSAIPQDADPSYAKRLLSDARYLAGLARRGRPPGLTIIENDEQIREPMRQMKREGRKMTQDTVAAYAGFSKSALRRYLRVNGRTWRELMNTL